MSVCTALPFTRQRQPSSRVATSFSRTAAAQLSRSSASFWTGSPGEDVSPLRAPSRLLFVPSSSCLTVGDRALPGMARREFDGAASDLFPGRGGHRNRSPLIGIVHLTMVKGCVSSWCAGTRSAAFLGTRPPEATLITDCPAFVGTHVATTPMWKNTHPLLSNTKDIL